MLFQVNRGQPSVTYFPETEKSSQNCFPGVKLKDVVSITYPCHCHCLLVHLLMDSIEGINKPLLPDEDSRRDLEIYGPIYVQPETSFQTFLVSGFIILHATVG